jgi:hypothetical protein
LRFPEVAKLPQLAIANEPAFLECTLQEIKKNPSYLSPLLVQVFHSMRPDALAIGGLPGNRFFSILLSNQLYSSPLHWIDAVVDFYSTDWQRVYHREPVVIDDKTADLSLQTEVNPKTKHLREKWENTLTTANMKHEGSLRIHVILPGIQGSRQQDVQLDRCRVHGKDIVLYVTTENWDKLFSSEICKILKEIIYGQPKATAEQDQTDHHNLL